MISLGRTATLKINRRTDFGFFLDAENLGEILMPNRYILPNMNIGDMVEVFVFLDGEERLVATTEQPKVQVGEVGYLKVVALEKVGAFLDWGVSKHLLVPFSEQKVKMELDRSYLVYVYIDKITDRIVATMKLEKFIDKIPHQYTVGQNIDLQIWTKTEVGYKAIINHQHHGILYHNEIFQPLRIGQKLQGYIKKVRPDGKIDLSIGAIGYQKVDSHSEKILNMLTKAKGFLPYNDKTDPDVIYKIFGMSKKTFKMTIGNLFKRKLLLIDDKGIHSTEAKT